MAEPARPVALAQDFAGMVSNADPRDIPPGAAEEQINLSTHIQGEMRVRLGIQAVTFEDE
jgi:hypothetical protein